MPRPAAEPEMTGASKELIANELSSILGDGALGSTRLWNLEGPLFKRSSSFIFLLRHAAEPSPLVVKWYYDNAEKLPAPDFARDQYDALRKTSLELGNNGIFRVPKPFALLEKASAVVMEQAPGIN